MTNDTFWAILSLCRWAELAPGDRGRALAYARMVLDRHLDGPDSRAFLAHWFEHRAVLHEAVRDLTFPRRADLDALLAHILALGPEEFRATLDAPWRAASRAWSGDYVMSFGYALSNVLLRSGFLEGEG